MSLELPLEDLEAAREGFETTVPRIENYPCGCVGQYAPEFGWKHYVNPDCKYDNKIHPKIKGYEYLSWDKLPKEATL